MNPNNGNWNGSTATKALSPNLYYASGNWNNLNSQKPTRIGYIFNGWFTAASGGTKLYNIDGTCINEGNYWKTSKYVHDGNLTVYAQWTPESYNWTVPSTVAFDANSNSNTKSGTISVTDNTLAAGRTLKIKVASDASFKLKDKSNSANTRDYTVKKGSEALKAGSTVLSLPTETKNANQAISFGLSGASGTSQIAGTYQDLLKFSASVE